MNPMNATYLPVSSDVPRRHRRHGVSYIATNFADSCCPRNSRNISTRLPEYTVLQRRSGSDRSDNLLQKAL